MLLLKLFMPSARIEQRSAGFTLATLIATSLRIMHFFSFLSSAFAVSLFVFGVELPTCKNFQLIGKSVELYWSLRNFAVNSPSNLWRLHCEPTETAVRLWRMHVDCAANHTKYNRNDVMIVL